MANNDTRCVHAGHPVLSPHTITVSTILTQHFNYYSNTIVIYKKINQRLPHCINNSILDPKNSEPFLQNASFENSRLCTIMV